METIIDAKTELKNNCISIYGKDLVEEFYASVITGKPIIANAIESKNVLYFDLCNVRPGFKFEHLIYEVLELYELSNGKLIPSGLCHSLSIQIELRMQELVIGTSYTLSEICGIEYWLRLSEVLRSLSDECVMF